MIGDFRTEPITSPSTIYVDMFWQGDRRMARLIFSPELEAALSTRGFPVPHAEPMILESALSYAVFLAMRVDQCVRLTGDTTVWNTAWGRLGHSPSDDDETQAIAPRLTS